MVDKNWSFEKKCQLPYCQVLGLQNRGISKRLEEYTEEEILQAFQKESENLSKRLQHTQQFTQRELGLTCDISVAGLESRGWSSHLSLTAFVIHFVYQWQGQQPLPCTTQDSKVLNVMLAQLKEFPGRTGQMQKLQDVHEAYQVLTKVIINSKQPIIKIPMKRSKWKKHCTQKIFNIDSKRGPSPPSPQL